MATPLGVALVLFIPSFDDALATTLLHTDVRDPGCGGRRPTHRSTLRRGFRKDEAMVRAGDPRRSSAGALHPAAQSDRPT